MQYNFFAIFPLSGPFVEFFFIDFITYFDFKGALATILTKKLYVLEIGK
jgi:hypothetical protein